MLLVAFAASLISFYFLVNLYFQDESIREDKFTAAFVWNTEERKTPEIEPLYLFQAIARRMIVHNESLASRVHESLISGLSSQASAQVELFSHIFRYWLREGGYFDPSEFQPSTGEPDRLSPTLIVASSTVEMPFDFQLVETRMEDNNQLELKLVGRNMQLHFWVKQTPLRFPKEKGSQDKIPIGDLWAAMFSTAFPNLEESSLITGSVFEIKVVSETSPMRLLVDAEAIDTVEWIDRFLTQMAALGINKSAFLHKQFERARSIQFEGHSGSHAAVDWPCGI